MRPHLGGLVFVWLSLMNPHRLTFGASYDFPSAEIVALTTLSGFALQFRYYDFPRSREALLILIQLVWYTITTLNALVPQKAWAKWNLTSKTLFITLLLLTLYQHSGRIRKLLLTITFSVAFYGVKGGIWGILTRGQYRVYGPPFSFIADNNALALAELMVLPLLMAHGRVTTNKHYRILLNITTALTITSIVLSYSRGALLGLVIFTGLILAQSRHKIYYILTISILSSLLLIVIPQRWTERMMSLSRYQQDPSAVSRINSWRFAINLANDRPILGGGFKAFDQVLFQKYAPNPEVVYDAHSIYCEVIGEHGYIGLILFIVLLTCYLLTLSWICKNAEAVPRLAWMKPVACGLRIGVGCYLVSGAFLGLAYFDLYYYFIAAGVSMKAILQRERAAPEYVATHSCRT